MRVLVVLAAVMAVACVEGYKGFHSEESSYRFEPGFFERYERLPQNYHGLKSSSSSSEEKQQKGRWLEYRRELSGLKSSSSSSEERPAHFNSPATAEYQRFRRDLVHNKASSSSSSSEEQKPSSFLGHPTGRWLEYRRELSGLKSSSSSEERPAHFNINPVTAEHQRFRRGLLGNKASSSSSSEEQKPAPSSFLGFGRSSISPYRSELKSSSSSSEEVKPALHENRFLGLFETEEKEKLKGRDDLHKIQHIEHLSTKERERIGQPLPTVLEGTYHVAYDPPAVVQAPAMA